MIVFQAKADAIELLKDCLFDTNDWSWVELWDYYDQTVAIPLRATLTHRGLDCAAADDVAQEVWCALRRNNNRKLRTFRGKSERELLAWLKRVTARVAMRWIRKQQRRNEQERAAISHRATSEVSGPSQPQIETLIHDLCESMDDKSAGRLKILAGLISSDKPISDRTRQRWTKQILDQYGDLFMDLQINWN